MYCKFHIAQISIIENNDRIIMGALEVFLSVWMSFNMVGNKSSIVFRFKYQTKYVIEISNITEAPLEPYAYDSLMFVLGAH